MTSRRALAGVTALILLGFALRLYHLGVVPFRGDEAFTAQNWAGRPLAEELAQIATIEPHPPLTYVVFRFWGLTFGINEFTLRLLPTLANLLGIPAMFAIGHRLRGRMLGVLAALMWALHPYEIWHSQDARNYAIWAGMSAVTIWLALRVTAYQRRSDWLLYIGAALVTVFTFYMELFTLAVLSLYVLMVRWRDRRFVRNWLAINGVIVAAILGTFVGLQGHLFSGGGYGGTLVSFSAPLWFTWFLPTLTFGDTLPGGWVAALWVVVLIALLIGWFTIWREKRESALFLALLGVVPLVLLGMVSLKVNIFHPRYVLAAVPGFILTFAWLVVWTKRHMPTPTLRQITPIVLLGGILLVNGYSLYNYFFDPTYLKSHNWAALSQYLHDNVQPDDLVIQTSVDAAFGYYYHSKGVPARDIGLPANPQETRDAIVQTLTESQTAYRSIWAVGRTFSDWPNAGIVEQWLQDHMQRVRATSTAGLPIQQFMPWEVGADEVSGSPSASFAETASLVGTRVFPREPTGELTVWLYWRPVAKTNRALKVFVHLLGATNPQTGTPLWTQDDHFPQSGRIDTTNWDSSTVYRDVFVLPAQEVPAGDYHLEIGFYDPDTNQRVKVGEGDSYMGETVILR